MTDDERRISAVTDSLLAALCYFDIFGYPLTVEELRRWRYVPEGGGKEKSETEPSLSDVQASLALLVERGLADSRDGFWFLSGSADTVAERQRRFRLTEPKWRRARVVAWLLAKLPSVRFIAVCNSLSWNHAYESSDIDLFVVVRPGTIWVTRFLTAGALAVFGLRPDTKTHADRICLSFLVTEPNLNLERLAVSPEDSYLRYWVATVVPVFDPDGLAERFQSENGWAFRRLPGAWHSDPGPRRSVRSRGWAWLGPVLRLLERPTRRWQMRRFPGSITGQANLASDVLVSDDILKFHVRDERRRFQREFAERLRRYGLA